MFETFEKINANEIGIRDNIRNVTYNLQGNTGLYFYNWHEKVIFKFHIQYLIFTYLLGYIDKIKLLPLRGAYNNTLFFGFRIHGYCI